MGQGAESCGGYEVLYEPQREAPDGVWIQRNYEGIHVSKMTTSHIRNAKRIAKAKADTSNFSDDEDFWNSWVDLFEDELLNRAVSKRSSTPPPVRFRTQCLLLYVATKFK